MRTPTQLILNLAAATLLATAMACGGGGGGSSTETATISGSVASPTTTASIRTSALAASGAVDIAAVDQNGNKADEALGVTDTFTLTVPTGHDYVLIVSDSSGILSAVVYQDSTGSSTSEMQIGAGTKTVDLGTVVVDATNRTAEVKDSTAVQVEVKDPAKTATTIEPDKKIMGTDTDGDHIPDVMDKATDSDGQTKDMSHDQNNDGTQDVGDDADQPDPSESDSQKNGTAGDAVSGASLFATNCALCHGADAKGMSGNGPNIVGEGAGDIRDAIGEVGAMGSLSSLTDAQLTDIAAWLADPTATTGAGSGSGTTTGGTGGSTGSGSGTTTGGGSGSGGTTPVGNASTGKTAFDASCSGCHGANATGNIGPNIVGASAATVSNVLTNGKGAMPAFAGLASSAADIAAYLATL